MAPRFVVVMPLTTTLTISSLPTPMPTATLGYIPVYNARPDGSLITLRYMKEIQFTNVRLLVIGIFLMLFIRNTIVSIDYLRRSRAKHKTLFYLLLASQFLGPICLISHAASTLSSAADCRAVHTLSLVCIVLSQALLNTGILGIKAYRCLDRSRIVLIVISILQVISTALLCLDVSRLRSFRMASGVCDVAVNTPMAILALFCQSFFIFICFCYTVWKASAYSAAQGRLSLVGTLETVLDEPEPISPVTIDPLERRGWWDYVPPDRRLPPESHESIPDNHSVFSHISRALGLLAEPSSPGLQRIPSMYSQDIHPDHPLPLPVRTTSHAPFVVPRQSEKTLPVVPRSRDEPVSTPTHRRHGRHRAFARISRIRFVRAAMRDELLHTAAVVANCILTTILISVGFFKYKFTWIPTVCLGVNWIVTSLIVMHSFSQVVKRHEREAILREPNAWDLQNRLSSRREEWQPALSASSISTTPHGRLRRHVYTDIQNATRSWEDHTSHSVSSAFHSSAQVSETPDPFQGPAVENPFEGSEDIESQRKSQQSTVETKKIDYIKSHTLEVGPPSPSS